MRWPRAALLAVALIGLATAGAEARRGEDPGALSVSKISEVDIDDYSARDAMDGVPLGGKLLFYGWTSRYDAGLWRTNGTPKGTRLVEPIGLEQFSHPLGGGNRARGFQALDAETQLLYVGSELWRTDGKRRGTSLVRRVKGSDGYRTFIEGIEPASHGRAYMLTSNDGGGDVWRTDGTVAGTARVWNFERAIRNWEAMGSSLLFTEVRSDGSARLMRTDGVRDQATPIAQSWFLSPREVGDRVVFSNYGDGENLWRTDGTPSGTRPIVSDQGASPMLTPRGVGPVGDGSALITGFTRDLDGYALWKLSSTDELSLLEPSGEPVYVNPLRGNRRFATVGGKVFFAGVQEGESRNHLWVSDGSSDGTHVVPTEAFDGEDEGYPSIIDVRGFGDGVVVQIRRDDLDPDDGELWFSDGTVGGTRVIDDGGGTILGQSRHGLMIERDETSLWRLGADPSAGTARNR